MTRESVGWTQWLRPTNGHTPGNVAFLTLEQYGKNAFVEDCIMKNVTDGNGRTEKQIELRRAEQYRCTEETKPYHTNATA